MGRQLKTCFRVEEMGKLQWFKGQILNYDPTSGQYGIFSHLIIRLYGYMYIYPNDKDVKFLD